MEDRQVLRGNAGCCHDLYSGLSVNYFLAHRILRIMRKLSLYLCVCMCMCANESAEKNGKRLAAPHIIITVVVVTSTLDKLGDAVRQQRTKCRLQLSKNYGQMRRMQ